MKVTQCKGEGQGSCKRCTDNGKWNRHWMCFLYKIEGHEGCYCRDCVKEIKRAESDGADDFPNCKISGCEAARKDCHIGCLYGKENKNENS